MANRADYRKRFVKKALGYTKASQAQIAARLGMAPRGLRRIVKKLGIKRKYSLQTGPKGPFGKRKITGAKKAKIMRLAGEEGMSQQKLAKKFRVSQPRINKILKEAREQTNQ